jgi:hypothetical protein
MDGFAPGQLTWIAPGQMDSPLLTAWLDLDFLQMVYLGDFSG